MVKLRFWVTVIAAGALIEVEPVVVLVAVSCARAPAAISARLAIQQ